MTAIRMKGLVKSFGETQAVDGIDLTIESGELFFLLGPSGCGKTTLLRMLAGFIEPTEGEIYFGEKDVTNIPPNKRNTGMVFQSYALWPHMNVIENVMYGLKVRKLPSSEQKSRAIEALETVQMGHLSSRKPNELSGGQQQRIALARAIVVEPDVLLLDEPLSNLDAKLRLEMRGEIRRICTSLDITTVYVTHDQKEALSIADRMAVLKEGKIQQVGSPQEIYSSPASSFVAEFIGETNFINAKSANGVFETAVGTLSSTRTIEGTKVICSIRPESIKVHQSPASVNAFSGTCVESIYLGELAQHQVQVTKDIIFRVVEVNPSGQEQVGQRMHLSVDPEDVVPLPSK